MGIWILNAAVLNGGNELAAKHVLVEGNQIERIIEAGTAPDTSGHTVIDAQGKFLAPG